MILLDKPFVSEFLKQTIVQEGFPVLRTDGVERFSLPLEADVRDQADIVRRFDDDEPELFYTNSENALGWMLDHLGFSDLPEKITLFKDKVRFRELLKPLYPDFYFREISLDDLLNQDADDLPMPCVIKPAVGFFSMGVHAVANDGEWQSVRSALRAEMEAVQALYPGQVLDTTRFIIESWVDGPEFAVDAYYDGAGKVVILNILHHLFSSAEDVSDRVYITSREIIATYSTMFSEILAEIGDSAALRNFPVHAELRIDSEGRIVPIEINPMRFAGWCTTDVAYHAYGINPYSCFLKQDEPDWSQILDVDDTHLYSIVVLDKPGDIDAQAITDFNYDGVRTQFEEPLEVRKIDYREYPVFGFLFAKTRKENMVELERILRSDLKEFIT